MGHHFDSKLDFGGFWFANGDMCIHPGVPGVNYKVLNCSGMIPSIVSRVQLGTKQLDKGHK